nr:MAG TPA: hypothetical protein [Caudoviricetes sp.]
MPTEFEYKRYRKEKYTLKHALITCLMVAVLGGVCLLMR